MLLRTRLIIVLSVVVVIALFVGCGQAKPTETKPDNQKPVVTAINGPSEIVPGGEGEFYCAAYDPDGDIVEYSWSCPEGTFKGQDEKVTFIAPNTTGKYVISVSVKDSAGAYAMYLKEVRVTETPGNFPGEEPIVLKIKLGEASPISFNKRLRIWSSAIIDCAVESNSKNITYDWTANCGKLQGKGLAEGTASRIAWIAPGTKSDCALEVTVKDENGNVGKGIVNFTVVCCGN